MWLFGRSRIPHTLIEALSNRMTLFYRGQPARKNRLGFTRRFTPVGLFFEADS